LATATFSVMKTENAEAESDDLELADKGATQMEYFSD
jgi:hypothetical protein